MDLYLLDENFEICGIVDDFSSLVWNRNYYSCGNFKLQTGINDLQRFNNAKYLFCKDFDEVGVFETFDFIKSNGDYKILRTGRFIESLLSERVILPTQKYNNKTTEYICRDLVDKMAINPTDTDRIIPNLELGNLKGLGNTRSLQTTGKNLMERLYELCQDDEMSWNIKYDFDTQKLQFNCWKGLNRLDTQNINTWAIFSNNFENILSDEYSLDTTQYCNYAYVLGEARENEPRKQVIVDQVGTGEERRELYVDARDLQKDEETTESEYEQILYNRGVEKLTEARKVEEVTFKIDPFSNLIYKTDYDLGDLVVYKNAELGIVVEDRLTGISLVYENGSMEINVTFGSQYNLKRGEIE